MMWFSLILRGELAVAVGHGYEAAQLRNINFLLRPQISAAIVNDNSFQIANDAALPFISADLAQDAALYPPLATLRQTEFLLPLSRAGERAYAEIWEDFLNTAP